MSENFAYWIDKYQTDESFMNQMYQDGKELDDEDVKISPADLSEEDWNIITYAMEDHATIEKFICKQDYDGLTSWLAKRSHRQASGQDTGKYIAYLKELADKCHSIFENYEL